MPINILFENPVVFVAWVAAVVIAIGFHEFSHVFSAYLQGDETGKHMGRLTLNPFAHIDPIGLILLLVAGFGWGKPAPFNPDNLRNRRFGSTLVALAGPLSNLLLIVIFGLIFRLVFPFLNLSSDNVLLIFFVFLIQVNIVLMVFNLLPIPPLDGSHILMDLLPERYADFKMSLQRYGPILLIALVFFGGGLLSPLFRFFSNLAAQVIG